MFLVRKITRAKWDTKLGLAVGEIPADAVTVDLRTQENSLSFWRCSTDSPNDVEQAALAIAAASERVDRLDIVWLSDDKIQADGQVLTDTEGRTPVTDMADMHVEMSRLDYVRLGNVAEHVVAAIDENRYRRLTKATVKKLVVAAVAQGRIDPEALQDGVRIEVAS